MRNLLAAALLLYLGPAGAMIFPHLDFSPHLERGRPGPESFGTLVDARQTLASPSFPTLPKPVYARAMNQPMEAAAQRYEDLLAQRESGEAIAAAEALLAATKEYHGEAHVEFAHALSDLGAAYLHAGDPARAIRPLERAIRGIEQEHGIFSDVLVGPLAYLGVALQALGKHEDALDAFTRAQHVTHRHYGTENPYQAPLVYAKAESWSALDEAFETEEMLRLGLKLARKHHGEESADSLPALYQLAEWLRDSGDYRGALSLYRDAMQLLEGEDGEDTPAMVPAMRGKAMTFLLQQDVEVDRGLRLHRRIAALTETHPEAFSPVDRIEAQLDLGDWLTLFEREEEAWAAYRRAWALAAEDDSRDWAAELAEPRVIYAGPNLTREFMGYGVIGDHVFYDFEFSVAKDGRPRRVKVLDGNLHATTRTRAIDFLRLGKFRPALVEGQPKRYRGFQLRRSYPTNPPADYGRVAIGGGIGAAPTTHFERRWPGGDR